MAYAPAQRGAMPTVYVPGVPGMPGHGHSALAPTTAPAPASAPTTAAAAMTAAALGSSGACSGISSAVGKLQSAGAMRQMSHQPSAAMSDLNTSVGASSMSRAQLGFERRIAWLEEDVSVLHRRLRDECIEGPGGVASGDQALRSLVARLDGELAAERRSRESVEARLALLEEALQAERREREVQLRQFSSELDSTMKALINRIDEGLSNGAASMRERTDDTEARLRTLIARVDKGLGAGAAALQGTLDAAAAAAGSSPGGPAGNRPRSPKRSNPTPVTAGAAGSAPLQAHMQRPVAVGQAGDDAPQQLMQTYSQLQQENRWLKERRAQMHGSAASPGQGVTPSCTPSLAYPSTLQVPGSGLGLPGAAGAGACGSPLAVGARAYQGRTTMVAPGGRYTMQP